jgi:drug/metabolite transporter (DMT)-like permease
MRHARTFRNRNGGGVLEDLLRSTRDLVAGTLLESAKEASREILRRTMTVTLLYVVAAALLGTGLILLLIGGFEALRLIPLPDAAAYAIMGLLALGGGFAAVHAAKAKNRS